MTRILTDFSSIKVGNSFWLTRFDTISWVKRSSRTASPSDALHRKLYFSLKEKVVV